MTVPLSDIATAVLATTFQLSPFYLFAGMGEIVSEKSGVANMGLEGIMLMSLVLTFIVDYATGNPGSPCWPRWLWQAPLGWFSHSSLYGFAWTK